MYLPILLPWFIKWYLKFFVCFFSRNCNCAESWCMDKNTSAFEPVGQGGALPQRHFLAALARQAHAPAVFLQRGGQLGH